MIIDKTYIFRYGIYFLLVFFLIPSASFIHAQNVDEEGEMFWGEEDDDEEYEDEE